MRYFIQFVVVALLLAACAQTATSPMLADAGLSVPPGFRAELYAQGLSSPTALAFGPDGRLYVTQLNGAESAGASCMWWPGAMCCAGSSGGRSVSNT